MNIRGKLRQEIPSKLRTFQTTKLLLFLLHETTKSVAKSSTMSYVLLRNGAGEFTIVDSAMIINLNHSETKKEGKV